MKEWELIWNVVVFGKGVKFWGTDEKTKSNNENAFHPALKFYTLSFFFWFLRMLECPMKSVVCIYLEYCCENGRHLQKTKHYSTECDGAVAQVWVSFFYLLIGMFLIAFINSWCHRISWQSQSQFTVELCLVTVWHRLLWKQLLLCALANKKWYSCWLFWFCGF